MKKYIALIAVLAMVLCLFAGCGDKTETTEPATEPAAETTTTASEEPSAEMPSGEPSMPASGDKASGAPSGDKASGAPSGPMGGEVQADTSTFDELTLADGSKVTGVTMSYTDAGDNSEVRTFSITCTVAGAEKTFTGFIDKGVFTADSGDAVEQAIVDAVQEAQAASGVGKPSGMPSGDKASGAPSGDKASGAPASK